MESAISKELDTAVLFLVFNRPDVTQRVLDAIRDVRPPRIYIAADGARKGRKEQMLCKAARAVATNIDWPCEVKTLFREENLGCRRAVSGAIDWFFEQEVAGIILEDDCLPSRSFFFFCEELLKRYADDDRVNSIVGNNFQYKKTKSQYSYYFSRYNHVWGWASWRRSWQNYDHKMKQWPMFRDTGGLRRVSDSRVFEAYWREILNLVDAKKIDSWAYVWTFSAFMQNTVSCVPEKNLVRNIGFGSESTHTSDSNSWLSRLEACDLDFPLRHPDSVYSDVVADKVVDRRVYKITRMYLLIKYLRKKTGFKPLQYYLYKGKNLISNFLSHESRSS